MRNKIFSVAATLALLSAVLTGCKIGGDPKTQGCDIRERATNSAGVPYLHIVCQKNGVVTSDYSTPLGDVNQWPNCVVGAYFPGCKKG